MSPRTLALILLCVPFRVFAQDAGYYVVIGAYAIESNAQRAMSAAHSLNYPAVSGYQADRKLHYVFIRVSSDKKLADATAKAVRAEGFKDAWVYHGNLNYEHPHEYAVELPREKAEPHPAIAEQPEEPKPKDIQTQVPEIQPSDKPVVTEAAPAPVPAGKPFIFKLTQSENGNAITGLIRLQENDRSTQFRPYVSNQLVYVVPPSNRNQRYHLVCNVIGFKPFRANFSYKDAENLRGTTIGTNKEIILPVPLERVKKGDYVELDEVKFYTDSDVLTPESERELKELLNMLNENSNYAIRLHGHTNGNQGRDIVSCGDNTDLFHTSASNRKFSGTAKELSELRAGTVKRYLLQNGIDGSRIKIRGAGGKEMIFDPKTTLAGLNDRVEVEITRD